jgi:hypothetical protein
MLSCTFGMAPSTMTVIPKNMVNGVNMPAANIMDNIPMVNIMPFGMCQAPTNPAVIAATSAAAGVFTPAPCIPATTAPWTPGAAITKIKNMPALNSTCTLMCTWAGVITVTNPGQTKVTAK